MNDSFFNYLPLDSLEDWEQFVAAHCRKKTLTSASADLQTYRHYNHPAQDTDQEFYRLNHTYQTYDFVHRKEKDFLSFNRRAMTVWEATEFLNQLDDDTDPGTSLSQQQRLLQTAEAIRADDHPDWFILTGLIHDLGKILCLFGEPPWAVVGDTFPVGCRYSEAVVYPEFFYFNPDYQDATYQTQLGVYTQGCGLRNVHLSWGHNEYLYHIVKNYLPEPALYMIRYRSFYAAHRQGAYHYLMDDHDREMFAWVKKFNHYELHSKSLHPPDVDKLRPYYEQLIDKYLPGKLHF